VGLRGPRSHSLSLKSQLRREFGKPPDIEPIATRVPTSSAAIRVRRHRERQKNGRLVVMVELDASDLETLVEAQLLDGRADCFNREAIAMAIRNYLQISRNA
jgi:hypothetical protein